MRVKSPSSPIRVTFSPSDTRLQETRDESQWHSMQHTAYACVTRDTVAHPWHHTQFAHVQVAAVKSRTPRVACALKSL